MAQANSFTLKVEGEAEIPLPAERAIINVKVSSDGADKATVSNQVLTAAKHVEKLLIALSSAPEESTTTDDPSSPPSLPPLAHWSKTTLSATTFIPPSSSSCTVRHHRSTLTFDIRFRTFHSSLGPFATTITSIPHVEIHDIEWILTEETRATHLPRLRQLAAKNALQRARDYCQALGCGGLRAVELDEEGGYRSARKVYHMASQEVGAGRPRQQQDDGKSEGVEVLEFTRQDVKMSMSLGIVFYADAIIDDKNN